MPLRLQLRQQVGTVMGRAGCHERGEGLRAGSRQRMGEQGAVPRKLGLDNHKKGFFVLLDRVKQPHGGPHMLLCLHPLTCPKPTNSSLASNTVVLWSHYVVITVFLILQYFV